MFEFLIIVISIIGVLMTLGILLQSGKGGGLAGIASGGATTQILGSRQAPDFLEKSTWYLGGSFIVLCILTTFAIDTGNGGESVIQSTQGQTQQPVAPGGAAQDGAVDATDSAIPPPPPPAESGENQ